MKEDKTSSASGKLLSVTDEERLIKQLRKENAQLRSQLDQIRSTSQSPEQERTWETEMEKGITYSDGRSHTSSISAARLLIPLAGITKEREKAGKIRNSSDFDYLPTPTEDEAQLEADFIRWGYCIVKDAMSPQQIQDQLDRLLPQAEAERNLNAAIMTSQKSAAQLVNNLVLKGQVFRDAVEFKECAAQNGPLVDRLLTKIMGEGFGLGCAHGTLVHQGGGLQDLHVDQGGMPMPYPPWPFGSLIIWVYSEFNLENGGTYIVPGSHRTETGTNCFEIGEDLMKFVDGEPGLVAICAPPGACILTDTRVLHGGGLRTAPGTRYAMRCHYNRHFVRALHEQSSANLHVPDDVYNVLSDRLKHMMGISVNNPTPLVEMSPPTEEVTAS